MCERKRERERERLRVLETEEKMEGEEKFSSYD